ncbi:MAG: YlxR family protein [Acidimicrobiales bacterium]
MRTCVGCRRTRQMDELLRVARDAEGRLTAGRDAPGRGAWLCRDSSACVDRAIHRRAFDRAFRVRLEDGQVDRERLAAAVRQAGGKGGARRTRLDDVRG